MSRILIIEDERRMRMALEDCLAGEGHRILTANDGAAGLERAVQEKPDLVLLDIMMPKLDGFAVCGELRRLNHRMPILMLTAKAQVDDRVHGLDSGADDYLVKPFSTEELLARVRALLRRVQRQTQTLTAIQLGHVKVDFIQRRAWADGVEIHFKTKEFTMLQFLCESQGEVITRERFLDVVWGCGAFPTTRTVDNHVARLRAKIERDPEHPRYIHTVHGVGYRFLHIDDKAAEAPL
jgi:DNA-binding response OmpR family regulator